MSDLKDRTISHYRILREIGAGGMGSVYLAEDTRLNRKAAIKTLLPEVASDPDRLRRFEREAQAASALNHPNILTVYEFAEDDGVHCLITEHVDGRTLRELIRSGELTITTSLSIAEQVAFALSSAHAAGIIHRDLKPENVLVRNDGIVKVVDFGLAKLLEKGGDVDPDAKTRAMFMTNPGLIMGTASYMSPEQARGLDTDERTDIWSLGVVIYEMISGRRPFEGDSANEVIARLLMSEPEPLSKLHSYVPDELEALVGKTLRKDRDERYQNTKDFWNEIRDLRQKLEYRARFGQSTASQRCDTSDEATLAMTAAVGPPTDPPVLADSSEIEKRRTSEHSAGLSKGYRRLFIGAVAALLLIFAGVAVWALKLRSTVPAAEVGKIESVAVLPFENASGSADTEFLSDGLSQTLIDKLSQLPQLKVIARTSSFKYRDPNADVHAIASKLGVQAIVMGKVLKVGDQLSVHVELIDVASDKQIWGDQFDRPFAQVLSMQQEIAQTVSAKLRLKLTGAQESQLAKKGTENPQAYEAYLKAVNVDASGRGTESTKEANQLLQQAVSLDPNYALAWAALGINYSTLAGVGVIEPKEASDKSEAAYKKALELDPDLAQAHVGRAKALNDAWQWQAADDEYKSAIQLNPGLSDAHLLYSEFLSVIGRNDEAIAESARAVELDPLDTEAHLAYATALNIAKRYDESIEAAKRVPELDLNCTGAHVVLGYDYTALGRYQEALEAHLKARELGDDSPSNMTYIGAAYAKNGQRDKALEILKELKSGKNYASPGELPILLIALGDYEAAFTSLEKAYADRDPQLQYLNADPSFDPIRNDPRFIDLVRRVGLSS